MTQAVREARVIPLTGVAAAVPPGQERVSAAQREAAPTERRFAEHRVRMTGAPLDNA